MRIIHPRPELGRQKALGVEFRDGIATVETLHPERELALLQHGFTLEADPEVTEPYQAGLGEPIIDLEKLTKAELRGMLPKDAEVPAKASHAELVKLVSELPAATIPGGIDNGDGTFTMPGMDISTCDICGGESFHHTVECYVGDTTEASEFED